MFTKSVYDHLTLCPGGAQFSHILKANIPYKIKIFTWLVENGAVLTKDSMVKRKWLGDPTCVFCDQLETVDHLLFSLACGKMCLGNDWFMFWGI